MTRYGGPFPGDVALYGGPGDGATVQAAPYIVVLTHLGARYVRTVATDGRGLPIFQHQPTDQGNRP